MFKEFFKFKKSDYPIIPVAFFCLVVFALLSILLIFKNNYSSLYIKHFVSSIEPVVVNIDTKNAITSNAFVCYDNNCSVPEKYGNSKIYRSFFHPGYENKDYIIFKKIILAHPIENKDFLGNINSVDIHIGNRKYFIDSKDLSNIEPKEFKMEIFDPLSQKKTIKEYSTIELSSLGNYRGVYNNICVLFLSLFYNWKIFIIPYLWLFFAFVFYLFNKEEIKINFKIPIIAPLHILGIICLIGFLLRLDNYNYFPLWTDEVYTKTVAISSFVSCFKDAGNPPLFFILEYLISKIIGTSDIALRFLPCLFGMMTIPVVYLLFKNIDKKLALFASFMVSINTIFIYSSNDARGYSLCALLVVSSIYLLFEYLKSPTTKRLVLYGVLAVFCMNQNYYLMLFVFCNFIWGVIDLLQNKNNKKIINFLIANIVAFVSATPYLLFSLKNAVQNGFNGWIPPLSKELFKYAIDEFFINKYVFIFLSIVLLINLIFALTPNKFLQKINIKINKDKSNMLIYLVFSMTLIIILASFISIYIKPIFHKRVLLAVYMLLFLIEILCITSIAELLKENKYIKIFKTSYFLILSAIYFLCVQPMLVSEQCRLDDFMFILRNDIAKYEKDYEIHAITCDTEEYLNHYPEIKNLNIKWHYINTNSGYHIENLNKFDYIDKNKKSVIYFHAIAADVAQIALLNPDIDIFSSNSISTGRLIYEPKN